MLLVKTKIGKSKIHGLGLFADQDIPEGTVVCRFNPAFDRVLDDQRLHCLGTGSELAQDFVRHHGYLMDHRWWVPADGMMFCNHSDSPNLDSTKTYLDDYAVRDIQKGEELTVDYRHFDSDAGRKLA